MKWLVFLLCLLPAHPSFAWGKKGHEVVAYIGYMNLDDPTRKEVDYLVTLNPCYSQWTSEVTALPQDQRNAALFMLAATWPDAIKQIEHQPPYPCQPSLTFSNKDGGIGTDKRFSRDVPPPTLEASQNIGYTDDRRHQYWHFVDTAFSSDGTLLEPASTPNALSELILLSAALKSNEGNDLKSYDLVWIEHLVGDLHQPLHVATRFTSGHPHGDAGGNSVLICTTPNCKDELHGYWDDLPGPGNDLPAAIAMGQKLNQQAAPTDETLNIENPAAWVADSLQLAKTYAYASPVYADAANSSAAALDPAYEKNARTVVNAQLCLAGHRLAALLIDYLG